MPPFHHEIFHKALSSDIRREILISLSKEKKYYFLTDKKILDFLRHHKPVPLHLRHKPPHEIVAEAMENFNKRLDRIEKKLDRLLNK